MSQVDPFTQLLTVISTYPGAMSADTLHGFLTGMAIGPDDIYDTPWLASLLGQPEYFSVDAGLESVIELAETSVDEIFEALMVEDFTPRVGMETRDGHVLPRTDLWCQGFIESVTLVEQQWRDWTEQDDGLRKQLLAINVIADPSRYGRLLFEASVDLNSGAFLAEMRPLAGQIALRMMDSVLYLESEGDPFFEDTPEGVADDFDLLPTFDEQELRNYSDHELMALIVTLGDILPLSVIDTAALRGAQMLPLLSAHLDDTANWQALYDADPNNWWALHHCIMILGAMDEPRAATVLAGVFERQRSDPDNNLWEWFGGYWPALFHNKRGHATMQLRAIAEDRGIDWYGRIQALECVIEEAAAGPYTLDPALDWAAALAADPAEVELMQINIGHLLLDLPRQRHRPLLESLALTQRLYTGGVIDFDTENIEAAFARGDAPDWLSFKNPWQFYDPEQILERQRRWAAEDEDDLDDWDNDNTSRYEPHPRATPKLGRNDLCPCGSGKKYKKCCMQKLH